MEALVRDRDRSGGWVARGQILRRTFQGWRYLMPADSPRDLPKGRALDDALPPAMALALAEIG